MALNPGRVIPQSDSVDAQAIRSSPPGAGASDRRIRTMRKIPEPVKLTKPRTISCIALVRSQTHAMIWTPCTRPALRRDRFCAAHRDALDGAVLGLCAKASEKAAAPKAATP